MQRIILLYLLQGASLAKEESSLTAPCLGKEPALKLMAFTR